MKIKHKKAIFLIAAIIFVVVLLLFSPRITKTISKINTFKYVQSNQTELTEIAQSVIDGKISTPYQYGKYTMQYFIFAKEPVVEFNGYSFGIAPSGFYSGFYYSHKDIPVRFNGSGTSMEPYKNGWSYVTMGNQGYTEKICDSWYWFEFYF